MTDLFSYEPAKGVRDTSHRAAEILEQSQQLSPRRLDCLQSVARRMGSGYMVAQRLDLGVTQVRPRLTELEQMGLVSDSGKRNQLKWGTSEIVYQITDAGIAALAAKGLV